MRGAWTAVGGVVALVAAGCGSSAPSPSPTPRPVSAYLLTLDELRTPGFTAVEAAHPPDAASLPAHVAAASTVRYFREVPELATANGPVDVRSTVLRCDSSSAAGDAYGSLVVRADAVPGMVAISAGALGEQAHGDELTTTQRGVALVEVTLTWRTGNLVSILVVRGRDGGTGLSDALILAHAQTAGWH